MGKYKMNLALFCFLYITYSCGAERSIHNENLTLHAMSANPINSTMGEGSPIQIIHSGHSGDHEEIFELSSDVLRDDENNSYPITTVTDSMGHVRLIAWTVWKNGSISRVCESDLSEESATAIAMAISKQQIIVAMIDGMSQLKLLSYIVSSTVFPSETLQQIGKTGDSGVQAKGLGLRNSSVLQIIAMADPSDLFPGYFVTATSSLDVFCNLTLTTWSVDTMGKITFVHSISAGTVSEVSLIRMDYPFDQYISSSVRSKDGTLKVIMWYVDFDGRLARVTDSDRAAGRAWSINSASQGGSLYTGLETREKMVRIIRWIPQYTQYTFDILRVSDSDLIMADNSNETDIVAEEIGEPHTRITCAVQISDFVIQIVTWIVSSWGTIKRETDSGHQGEWMDRITLNNVKQMDHQLHWLISTGRTRQGRLKLIAWNFTSV